MARKVKGSEVTDSSKKIRPALTPEARRSEEHTSELQSP